MSRSHKRSAAIVALTGVLFAAPFLTSTASAIELPIPGGILPPEAEEALDEALGVVPPEVTEALAPLLEETDPVVADVLAELVALDVTGVQQASAAPGNASAAAVEAPGVLILGKSETTKTGARVTILNVAGQDLLTKEGDADGGAWGGQLEAAGQIVDAVHDGTCSSEDSCVLLLPATATTDDGTFTDTNSASFSAVSIQAGEDGITLLPNTALTNVTFGRCTDVATALLATGSGQLAVATVAALVGPKVAVGGVLQQC